MSTTVVPPNVDMEEYLRSEAMHKYRSAYNKKVEDPAPPVEVVAEEPVKVEEPAKVEPPKEEKNHNQLVRSARRQAQQALVKLGRLQEQNEELARRLHQLENPTRGGDPKPATEVQEPEPQRAAFATEEEYSRALVHWAKGSVEKTLKQRDDEQTQKQRFDAHVQHVKEMDLKYKADAAKFPDWEEVAAKASKVHCDSDVMLMLSRSDQRAAMAYNFAKNPKLAEELNELTGDAKILRFHRLEGIVEAKYAEVPASKVEAAKPEPVKEEKPAEVKPPSPTAAELDAKKSKPSASVSIPSGGGAPTGEPSMFLEDNTSINPAWKDWRNAKSRK